ncbi:MAG: cation transporter [Acidobacteria bacterium]|nr:MAG: cation transporter [Acidobacteriota bacterium]REJ98238.1 MAG: cation transporter [Acidobacteriota bacterium]REK16982.1 MAG: cation transporter [Acidobacteriota bacterium]REK42892.1 MAG: cation transporter [Acidobacteriota bacterium]
MEKTIFHIPKMDCPQEENLVRLKLDGLASVKNLNFDIPNRQLTVFHNGQIEQIENSVTSLNLGAKRLSTAKSEQTEFEETRDQRKLLWTVLAVNFAFFVIEVSTGVVSGSMGLVADSLDMLADAFVYGISLLAIGGTVARKKYIATLAGYFQIVLALFGFVEVVRRFVAVEEMPEFGTMIVVSMLALTANLFCLYLFQKSKSEDVHMRASAIFTSNDVIINVGVIVAGVLVAWFNSNKPDLIIGTIVFVVVIRGAIKILKLGK